MQRNGSEKNEQRETMIPEILPGRSMRLQVVEYYRDLIRSGVLNSGDHLPSARRLALELDTTESNVHHAFSVLANEGLIGRCQRTGSIVLDRKKTLEAVALYITLLPLQRGEEFTRLLITFISEELEKHHIVCHVIYETPSGSGMSMLRRFVEERRIQGIISRGITYENLPFFKSLGIIFTGLSNLRILNKVSIGDMMLFDHMFDAVKDSGAKSFGIITSAVWENKDRILNHLHSKSARAGIEFKNEWLYDNCAGQFVTDDARFAWHAYEYFKTLKTPPKSLMLFSDALISGLAMAFYHYGVRVPDDYKIVVHHTCENPVIFPFDCTLVQHSIHEISEQLVKQLIDLNDGKRLSPSKLNIRTIPSTVLPPA